MVIVDQALELAANIAGAVKEFFGFQSKKLDLKNAADVKAAAIAQDEVNAVNETEKAIARKDINAIRNDLAE